MAMSEVIERDEQGIPMDPEKRTAEMFLEEFLYRATDHPSGEIDMDAAIHHLLKMRELNSFYFFREEN